MCAVIRASFSGRASRHSLRAATVRLLGPRALCAGVLLITGVRRGGVHTRPQALRELRLSGQTPEPRVWGGCSARPDSGVWPAAGSTLLGFTGVAAQLSWDFPGGRGLVKKKKRQKSCKRALPVVKGLTGCRFISFCLSRGK